MHTQPNDQSEALGEGEASGVTVQVKVSSGEEAERACSWWRAWLLPIPTDFKGDILLCVHSWGRR